MTENEIAVIILGFIVACIVAFWNGINNGLKGIPASRGLFGWGILGLSVGMNLVWTAFDLATADMYGADIMGWWTFAALLNIGGTYFMGKIAGQWGKATNHGFGWCWLLMLPLAWLFMLAAKPQYGPSAAQHAVAAE